MVSRWQTVTRPRSRRHAVGSWAIWGSPAATMKPTSGQRTTTDSSDPAPQAALVSIPGRNAASGRPLRSAKNAATAVATMADRTYRGV